MNKKKLARELAKRHNLTNVKAELIVKDIFQIISEELATNGRVDLVNFGIFLTITRKARKLKMPNSDKVIQLNDTKVIKFRASKNLKKVVNEVKK